MTGVSYYIGLRKRILDRRLVEFGIHPFLAYVLAPLVFIAMSLLLFYKTEYAVYVYVALAISFLFPLADIKKANFLNLHFNKSDFKKLMLLEHLIVALPYAFILCFKFYFIWAIGLVVFAAGFSLLNVKSTSNFYVPTPFGKYPYEFATGFRKLFPVYLVVLFLLTMAVSVSNFNLGLFALALIPFVCINFYSEMENPFYVWIYDKTAGGFLKHKCLVASGYLTILLLPVFLVLAFVFPEMIRIILGVFILSYAYFSSYIVFKYVRYPQQLTLIQIIALTVSYLFPPLLPFTLSYYLPKANFNLQRILR